MKFEKRMKNICALSLFLLICRTKAEGEHFEYDTIFDDTFIPNIINGDTGFYEAFQLFALSVAFFMGATVKSSIFTEALAEIRNGGDNLLADLSH